MQSEFVSKLLLNANRYILEPVAFLQCSDTMQSKIIFLVFFQGLRSPRLGEQSEAIVKFPTLMDRFPFPILINVAFLKLADVFRTGYDN